MFPVAYLQHYTFNALCYDYALQRKWPRVKLNVINEKVGVYVTDRVYNVSVLCRIVQVLLIRMTTQNPN